jgi:hypothetical protein
MTTKRFTHAGLQCKVVKTPAGHWCGYVKVLGSLSSVQWRQDYDHGSGELVPVDVDVHGGITYGLDDEGWVGFDDAHATRLVDVRDAETAAEAVREETEALAEQIAALEGQR